MCCLFGSTSIFVTVLHHNPLIMVILSIREIVDAHHLSWPTATGWLNSDICDYCELCIINLHFYLILAFIIRWRTADLPDHQPISFKAHRDHRGGDCSPWKAPRDSPAYGPAVWCQIWRWIWEQRAKPDGSDSDEKSAQWTNILLLSKWSDARDVFWW